MTDQDAARSLGPTARLAILAVAALAVGVGGGVAVGRATADPPPVVVPDELQRADLAQPFADFFQAYHTVTTDSYYAPLPDRKRLIYAAINGMLMSGTGDPHTLFISPQENTQAQGALDGQFEGIGAYVDATTRGVTLIPLPGSPAARAGLRAGDLIVRIAGRDVTTASEDAVVTLLRGAAGTRVTLGVERTGVHGVLTVVVVRGRVTVPSVVARPIGNIAYLRLTQFGATTGREASRALRALLARHPRGLVLDLRDNPGGYVNTAIDVNSQFLPAGRTILWEENGKGQLDAPLRSLGGGQALTVPLAVLVNDGTASAAEITAGALQDYRRATIVGATTYGKGSVQQDYPLADGSSLRITIRLWLTPHKHLIQNRGITPDIALDSPVADGSARDARRARAVRLLETGR